MKHRHFEYDISNDVIDLITRLGSDSQAFANKSILITGGTGFFGRWLLQVLCTLILVKQIHFDIYVLSRNPDIFLKANAHFPFGKFIHFIRGDVSNFKLPNIKLDYLIHMAATAASETFHGEDQLQKINLLYKGTQHTLEVAIKASVNKVLFTSSGVVYGPSKGEPFSEEMLQAPKTTLISSALGEGKRLAEYLIGYYGVKGGFEYSIARCFTFFGPYMPLDIHYAIGNFVYDAINNEEITVKGSGEELRSYLYIADAWVWLLKLLVHADNQIYNVGSSIPISIKDLAALVRNTLAPEKQVKCLGLIHDVGNFNRTSYIPNNDKICHKYELSEWTTLIQGIKKMANA